MMGDIQGWGAYGGSKEARLTFKHTLQAHASPALQVTRNTVRKSPLWMFLFPNVCVLL